MSLHQSDDLQAQPPVPLQSAATEAEEDAGRRNTPAVKKFLWGLFALVLVAVVLCLVWWGTAGDLRRSALFNNETGNRDQAGVHVSDGVTIRVESLRCDLTLLEETESGTRQMNYCELTLDVVNGSAEEVWADKDAVEALTSTGRVIKPKDAVVGDAATAQLFVAKRTASLVVFRFETEKGENLDWLDWQYRTQSHAGGAIIRLSE